MMDYDNKYHILERQRELLTEMNDLHAFFCANNIQYSLCGGTLLGAVREGGFIPWDDDIDIMVDRNNFRKIISARDALLGYKIERYLWVFRIQSNKYQDVNLQNPTIDIFVFDNIPKNKMVYQFKLCMIKMLQGMMKKEIDYAKVSVLYKICLFVTHWIGVLVPDNIKFCIYDAVSQIGNSQDCDFVGCFDDLFKYLNLKYRKDFMKECVKRQFEDSEFMITMEYDHYLSTVYGDYMTPVKEEDRKPQHLS